MEKIDIISFAHSYLLFILKSRPAHTLAKRCKRVFSKIRIARTFDFITLVCSLFVHIELVWKMEMKSARSKRTKNRNAFSYETMLLCFEAHDISSLIYVMYLTQPILLRV